jgi:hypothetical protein
MTLLCVYFYLLLFRYIARSEFTRTTAVISIVGYILGLGDRHGENILLDSTNGGVVHVDFNCLFNRVLQIILQIINNYKQKLKKNNVMLHIFLYSTG